MNKLRHVFFKSGSEFRNWLEDNHNSCEGIYMLYYKVHTKIKCIEYNDALDEALCFGWIDSLVKRIDEQRYVRKFTPRRKNSRWSNQNLIHVRRLIEQKRMTKHGLSKIKNKQLVDLQDTIREPITSEVTVVPNYMIDILVGNQPAYDNFNELPQRLKNQYVRWITSAKKDETIFRRLNEAVQLLKKGEKLGMK